MSDQINSINELLAKAGNVSKAKKTDNISGQSFSKVLENAVSKNPAAETPKSDMVSDIFQTSFINPLDRINLNSDASKTVESGLDQMLSDLEIFSNLLGNSSIDINDLKTLADKIQENSQELLKISEKNNIPEELKSITRESTALAYAAFEKMGDF
jgi:flagellar hook-basal body complex protein FliE